MNSKINAEDSFENYFSNLYGKRWKNIYDNLRIDAGKIARINRFCGNVSINETVKNFTPFTHLKECYISNNYPKIPICKNGLKAFYLMDPASIIPVINLDIKKGESVLDMCAAPGGKSLIIAEILNGTGSLTLNDISRKRIFKMKKILDDYLPNEILSKIIIKNLNGTDIFFRKKSSYDKILLDAPCSAERHLLKKNGMEKEWKISGTKRVAIKQYSLISSALLSLKPTGKLVYSTCSLSEFENDKIIEKLLKRHNDEIEIESVNSFLGEATKHGWIILPEKNPFGPIYFSVIRKKK